jgi:hypothetical protein
MQTIEQREEKALGDPLPGFAPSKPKGSSMSESRDSKSRAAEAVSSADATPHFRPVPVRLAKRGGAAHSMMLSRVLPDNGVSRLDVAAFNSSI